MKKRLFGFGIMILAVAAGISLRTDNHEKENAMAGNASYGKVDDEGKSAEKEITGSSAQSNGGSVTIAGSQKLFSDEEKIQSADIILQGTLECKEKEGVLKSANYSIPYSLFKVKVSQYLLNDTEKEEEYVLFSYGTTELPDELEYGKEYVFYFTHAAEEGGIGEGVLSVVSLSQAVYEKTDNLEWENALGEEKSLEDIQKDIQEYEE